jgi:hypothetical protein
MSSSSAWKPIAGLVVSLIFLGIAAVLTFFGEPKERSSDLTGLILSLACFMYYASILITRIRLKRSKEIHSMIDEVVQFDEKDMQVNYSNGSKKSLRWSALTEVCIVTTDKGPHQPDIFWGFRTEEESMPLFIPQEAQGFPSLAQELPERLPGFNFAKSSEAMGSTQNAVFTVWRKSAA